MPKKEINWPVIGGAAAAVTAVGVGLAYLLTRPVETITEEKETKEKEIVTSPYNIKEFIINPRGILSYPSNNTVFLSHDGDEVTIICPYKYTSATFSRHDKIQESGKKTQESDSITTLSPGEYKTLHLTEENRNVDITITIVAAVEAPLTLVQESPHGSWKYRIYLSADGHYSYSIINPAGTESSLRNAANADDAALKAKAEIEAAGGTAPTVTEVYTPPPLLSRLQVVSDTILRGYRIIVYRTVPGGEHKEMLPSEYPAYWSVTRPDGSVIGPNGADSIAQATDTANNLVRAELPATTETIMYKNYKIDLINNPATTLPYYANITYPNGQYKTTVFPSNSRDECLTKVKEFIDPLAAADTKQAAYLAAAAKAKAEAEAKGKVAYEYNRYTLIIQAHRLGRSGIIYSPANNRISETNPYLTEAEVKNEANKKIDAHWASLTSAQQQSEIAAYNQRKGKAAAQEKAQKEMEAREAKVFQETKTVDQSYDMLKRGGGVLYKGYSILYDPAINASYMVVKDPSGKVATSVGPFKVLTKDAVKIAMNYINKKTGNPVFTGWSDSLWSDSLWIVKGGRVYVQGESNTFRKGPPWTEIEANVPERKWPYPAEYYPHSPWQIV
jgi:hypothetical protein